jgi:hypothetical protein
MDSLHHVPKPSFLSALSRPELKALFKVKIILKPPQEEGRSAVGCPLLTTKPADAPE